MNNKQRRMENADGIERLRAMHQILLGAYYDPALDLPLSCGYVLLGLWVTGVAVSGNAHLGVLMLACLIVLAPIYLVYRAEQRWRASDE